MSNVWTEYFLKKEGADKGPSLPEPHDVIVVTNKGKAVGHYDLTKGESVGSPPPPRSHVVGEVSRDESSVSYTPRDVISDSQEAEGARAVLEANGFDRSTASRVVSRQRRHHHHHVHARSSSQEQALHRLVDYAKGKTPTAESIRDALKPRPSAKVLQFGAVTTKEGVLWSPNGKAVYVSPVRYEGEVAKLTADKAFFKDITIEAPEIKPSPPKGYTGPVLKPGKQKKGLAALFQRAKSGYYGTVAEDAAWGADAFRKMFRAEVEQDIATGRRIAGVPGGIAGAVLGVALGATHGGAAAYYGLHHRDYARAGITSGEQMLSNRDLMLSDTVVSAPVMTIAAADTLPATATGAAEHDIEAAVPDAVSDGKNVRGVMRVKSTSGLGRVKTRDYVFRGEEEYAKKVQLDILDDTGAPRFTLGGRERSGKYIFRSPQAEAAAERARIREIERFVTGDQGRHELSWGTATVKRARRSFEMEYSRFTINKSKESLSTLVGTTDEGRRVFSVARVRKAASVLDKELKGFKSLKPPARSRGSVPSIVGRGRSLAKVERVPRSPPPSRGARAVESEIVRMVTGAAERASTAARVEASIIRALSVTPAVASITRATAAAQTRRAAPRVLTRASTRTVARTRTRADTITRQIERFVGDVKPAQASRAGVRAATAEKAATPSVAQTRVLSSEFPAEPVKVPPMLPPVKLRLPSGGSARVSARGKSAIFGERIHKIADIFTLMFGKKSRRSKRVRKKYKSGQFHI